MQSFASFLWYEDFSLILCRFLLRFPWHERPRISRPCWFHDKVCTNQKPHNLRPYFTEVHCFIHPIFRFWFLVTFGDEVTKIQKYYVIFVYILQGKMGKTEKNQKENHATKVTKIPKTKRQKYGMKESLEAEKMDLF